LYGSVDGGKTFKRIICYCAVGAQAIAFSSVVRDRLYLGDDGAGTILHFVVDGGSHPKIYRGEDGSGAAESRYYATRFYGNRVAFDPQAPPGRKLALILTTRFGAFESFDTGSRWRRIDTDAIPHHFIGVQWVNGLVYLAAFGGGVIRSSEPLRRAGRRGQLTVAPHLASAAILQCVPVRSPSSCAQSTQSDPKASAPSMRRAPGLVIRVK
jgi:hypothetical protein